MRSGRRPSPFPPPSWSAPRPRRRAAPAPPASPNSRSRAAAPSGCPTAPCKTAHRAPRPPPVPPVFFRSISGMPNSSSPPHPPRGTPRSAHDRMRLRQFYRRCSQWPRRRALSHPRLATERDGSGRRRGQNPGALLAQHKGRLAGDGSGRRRGQNPGALKLPPANGGEGKEKAPAIHLRICTATVRRRMAASGLAFEGTFASSPAYQFAMRSRSRERRETRY